MSKSRLLGACLMLAMSLASVRADPLVYNRLEASGSPTAGYTLTIPGALKGTAPGALHLDPGYLPALNGDIACLAGTGNCALVNIDIRGPGAAAQDSVGQLGRLTEAYTASMLNTKQDLLRAQLGNDCRSSMEFDQLPGTGKPNTAAAVITACISTPPGAYNGNLSWPDAAFQAIANSNNAFKSTLGMLSIGGVSIDGGFTEAYNGVCGNAPPGAGSYNGNGKNAIHLYCLEIDTDLYALAGGGAPSTDVAGSSVYLSGVKSTGNTIGYWIRGINWAYALSSDNASATTFALVGSLSNTGPSNSQNILFKCVGGSGALGAGGTDIPCGNIFGLSDGTLLLSAPGAPAGTGIRLASPVLAQAQLYASQGFASTADPGAYWTLDGSPPAVTVAQGGKGHRGRLGLDPDPRRRRRQHVHVLGRRRVGHAGQPNRHDLLDDDGHGQAFAELHEQRLHDHQQPQPIGHRCRR